MWLISYLFLSPLKSTRTIFSAVEWLSVENVKPKHPSRNRWLRNCKIVEAKCSKSDFYYFSTVNSHDLEDSETIESGYINYIIFRVLFRSYVRAAIPQRHCTLRFLQFFFSLLQWLGCINVETNCSTLIHVSDYTVIPAERSLLFIFHFEDCFRRFSRSPIFWKNNEPCPFSVKHKE